jgi:hypothetical protein
LEKANSQQYELDDKQDFYDMIQKRQLGHEVDLKKNADQEKVENRRFYCWKRKPDVLKRIYNIFSYARYIHQPELCISYIKGEIDVK